MDGVTCEYFLLCTNPADGVTTHPILTHVPTCTRCANRVGAELLAAEVVTA